jgi:hypothetical protein
MPDALPPKSVFICYRRTDTDTLVDFLYPRLADALSPEALFRDVDDMPKGVDFRKEIQRALRQATIVLVMIGPNWVSGSASGRLDDSEDHVRIEIETALGLPGVRVVPVLVNEMQMPQTPQLPTPLGPLRFKDAVRLRSGPRDFANDADQLVRILRESYDEVQRERALAADYEAERRREWEAQTGMPLPRPLDESQWRRLLARIESGCTIAVFGSEVATSAGEFELARRVAESLELPTPPAYAHRPLAELKRLSRERRQGEVEIEFADALMRATNPPVSPAPALAALAAVKPLRIFITSSLDRTLETVLAARACEQAAHAVTTLAYSPMSFSIDEPLRLDAAPAIVFHAAGLPERVPGGVAISDAEWQLFAERLSDYQTQPRWLAEALHEGNLLFIGGGHPAGFVEFWIRQLARSQGPLRFTGGVWLGASVLAHDSGLASYVRDPDVSGNVFDDGGATIFLMELARRWADYVATSPAAVHERGAALRQSQPMSPATDASGIRTPLEAELKSRWIGLATFSEQQRSLFYGRQAETDELCLRVRLQRLIVLAARSGMGKSSLLCAGLFPALRARGDLPIILRLEWNADSPSLVAQVLRVVEREARHAGVAIPAPIPDETLWSYFHRRDVVASLAARKIGDVVIALDQAEEFFTLGEEQSKDAESGQSFWWELGDLVEGRIPGAIRERFTADQNALADYILDARPPAVIVALRDDFLARLYNYTRAVPALRNAYFALGPLSGDAAVEAIRGPAPDLITREAAELLVRFVSGEKSRDWSLAECQVEPALLSLFCYTIDSERIRRRMKHVDRALIAEAISGGVLTDFYHRALAGVPSEVQEWIEDNLVTASGYRQQITWADAENAIRDYGAPIEILHELVERRLLRREERRGQVYLELAHDLLCSVITRARDQRH